MYVYMFYDLPNAFQPTHHENVFIYIFLCVYRLLYNLTDSDAVCAMCCNEDSIVATHGPPSWSPRDVVDLPEGDPALRCRCE